MRPDLMSESEFRDLDARKVRAHVTGEQFARWLRRHRAEHPEDRRPIHELLDVYVAEMDRLIDDFLAEMPEPPEGGIS